MDIIKEEILKFINEWEDSTSPKESNADYSDLLRRLKTITPSFLNTISKAGKLQFNKYISKYDCDGDLGCARFRIVTDFLYAIAERLDLNTIQFDWQNQDKSGPEYEFFQCTYWANTKKGDPVLFRTYIRMNSDNTINYNLSDITLEDENYDDIANVLTTNYDAHYAAQGKLAAAKYAKYTNPTDKYFWFNFIHEFNKTINRNIEKIKQKYTTERELGFFIASMFLIAVCKKIRITPLPELKDIEQKRAFLNNYVVEYRSGNIVVMGNISAFSGGGTFDVYESSTEVSVLDHDWHKIIAPSN